MPIRCSGVIRMYSDASALSASSNDLKMRTIFSITSFYILPVNFALDISTHRQCYRGYRCALSPPHAALGGVRLPTINARQSGTRQSLIGEVQPLPVSLAVRRFSDSPSSIWKNKPNLQIRKPKHFETLNFLLYICRRINHLQKSKRSLI